MITLLTHFFIKEPEEVHKPEVRRAYGVLCSLLGIGLNVCLFAGKFFAGWLSGSIAVRADAFNNLSDAGSSFITMIGFHFSGKKPDKDHPFGHGRIEYVSGLLVAALIVWMGLELGRSSLGKILKPQPVDAGVLSMVILLVSILVKLYMCLYNRRIGGRIASAAMKATAMDSLSDAVATTVVLFSMLLTRFAGVAVDGWCGALVALFIIKAGYDAAKDTLTPLLGQAPDPDFIRQIKEIVTAHEEIMGIHDLIVHDYGPGRVMISLHGEVDGNGNIYMLHDAIDRIERELKEKLFCDAVIHMDPIAVDDTAVMAMKERLEEELARMDFGLSLHDFRMVQGPTHTNLIFDVAMPSDCPECEEEIQAKVEEMVREAGENFYPVIRIDKTYV
ncbi:MAG: cation transporter [Lachnospiraceae bacterium]|nr:cation transporter [Lachnospiraceae bacterium]